MNELPKIPVGLGSKAGFGLTLLALVGGVVLLLAGKTPEEKEAGKLLLAVATPVLGGVSVHGRMTQGAAQQTAAELEGVAEALPGPLKELADAGLRLVESSPDGVDGPHVADSGAPTAPPAA